MKGGTILKKGRNKLYSYIELVGICILISFLIILFNLPNILFIVLGVGILVNIIYIEIKNRYIKNCT